MSKTIAKLPQPPTAAEPQNFDERADAFVEALPQFVTETNALAAQVEENLQTTQTHKEDADASKQAAQASAQAASEAKEAAARSASEAESSAQAAAQIKTQTQEIKQSATREIQAIADAAQSSAQAAKQSEQAAEQTKTELQTATQALQDMKSIVKDGFIDDGTQSETKTYSSEKIARLNETLKTEVAQKLSEVSKEARAAAMSGVLPTPYESDLAMWDYMDTSKAVFEGNASGLFFKDWCVGVNNQAARAYTRYPNLNQNMQNYDSISNANAATAILDADGNVIAAIREGYIYKKDDTVSLKTQNKDGVSINAGFKIPSVAAKFILYNLNNDAVAVFGPSGDHDVLKYLYKATIKDFDKNYSARYVFYDVLKVIKQDGTSQTYKITGESINQIADVDLPREVVYFNLQNSRMPFYKDFLLYKSSLYRPNGETKTFPVCGEILGFLGGTPYLLQRAMPLGDVFSQNGKKYLYTIFDVENGARRVLLPLDKEPVSAYLEDDGYAYIVFTDGVVKIPAKYLTGANFKGE